MRLATDGARRPAQLTSVPQAIGSAPVTRSSKPCPLTSAFSKGLRSASMAPAASASPRGSASSRAMARPTTPAPTTTASTRSKLGLDSNEAQKGNRALTPIATLVGYFPGMPIRYRSQWYILEGEAPLIFALGIHGQNLFIARKNELVIAKLSSQALPLDAERVGARGAVVLPRDAERAKRDLQAAYAEGFRSVAIVFMHGYRYTDHERRVAELAEETGFPQISVSHRVSPLMKLIGRGDTTVVDAYLSPILGRYVRQVASELEGVRLFFMQSNGGLADARRFQGKDAILSGPAGGIVGAARTAEAAGFERIIGFDMGGTSTDVSHYAGSFEREFETKVAGVRMRAPMMSIHTVAAGRGSILHYDGSRYRVGPDSAGANPGPACYRRGGPLSVTDANLMLGKIQPAFFPDVFGPGGDQALDAAAVRDKFRALAGEIRDGRGEEAIAEGFVQIAVGNMANAIKHISVQRGHGVTRYTLCCFCGAAGQHACLVADALGMTRVFIHPHAGVLSAYGMGLADQTAMRERAVEAKLDPSVPLERVADELMREARDELVLQGVPVERIRVEPRAHLKYDGTDTALVVNLGPREQMLAEFEGAYRKQFSFLMPNRALIAEAVSV